MKRIVKRSVTGDAHGHVLHSEGERLTDDGKGNIRVTKRRAALWCPSCVRPLTDVKDIRGRCDWCRSKRNTCVTCWSRCSMCNRVLGGCCTRGFPGHASVAVCPGCFAKLRSRQIYTDAVAARQMAMRYRILQQRELLRRHALRLQAARFKASNRIALLREMMKMRNAGRGRYITWKFG